MAVEMVVPRVDAKADWWGASSVVRLVVCSVGLLGGSWVGRTAAYLAVSWADHSAARMETEMVACLVAWMVARTVDLLVGQRDVQRAARSVERKVEHSAAWMVENLAAWMGARKAGYWAAELVVRRAASRADRWVGQLAYSMVVAKAAWRAACSAAQLADL